MRDQPVEKLEKGGFTAKLYQDELAESRRDWGYHLGTMTCFHRRYSLGDKQDPETSPEDFAEFIKTDKSVALALPLYLLDHSGLAMRCGRGFGDVDPGSWDSGLVGWIYVTTKGILKEYGGKKVTKAKLATAEKVLRAEVEEYDSYLQGDIYLISIEGPSGEVVESCGGFIGWKYAKQEAEQMLKEAVEVAEDGELAERMLCAY